MRKIPNLYSDCAGNFGVISAFMAIPLVMSVGLMLDLSSISKTRTELQSAMDAAVLAVAREGKALSDERAREIADTYLGNNFDRQYTQLNVLRDGTAVTVDAKTQAHMAFGGLLGYANWPVVATASADIAYAHYEIALVLDTTGSMAGGKMTSMQNAVLGLIDTMTLQVPEAEKLKFALVPFSSFVNVGSHFGPTFNRKGQQRKGTGAEWLDLAGKVEIPQVELKSGVSRFQLHHNTGQDWLGCVETRVPKDGIAYDVADVAPGMKKKASLFVPAFAIDEGNAPGYRNDYIESPVEPTDQTLVGQSTKLLKYGIPATLVGDILGTTAGLPTALGSGDDDVSLTLSPSTNFDEVVIDSSNSGYGGFAKGPSFGCVTKPIRPLGSDYEAVRTAVKGLVAQGNTNIMEGVAWGMRVLSPQAPFSEGKALTSKGDIQKIMIVLTDGANTFGNSSSPLKSHYSSYGYLVDGRLGIADGGTTQTNQRMNDKTMAACTNAKAAGTTVYTIRLEEPDVKTGTMLQECASTPEHYFDAPSRNQLDEVFKAITDRIVRIRMSS